MNGKLRVIDLLLIIQMKNSQFPKKKFQEALLVTKKVKTNLKPFLDEYSKYNLAWLFESFTILITNLTHPKTDPLVKMNSMFAIKCIMDSTQYAPIAFVEAFALPIISRGASYNPNEQSDNRGSDYFLKQGYKIEEHPNIENYGFNYVKLCFEILQAAALIKPRALYYNQETKDPSNFTREYNSLLKILKDPPEDLVFYKTSPEQLRKSFRVKLKDMGESQSEAYAQFIEGVFVQQMKQGFQNLQYLDIRELYKTGDFFLCDDALELINQYITKGKPVQNVEEGISFINQLTKAGVFQVMIWGHNSKIIKFLVKNVDSIEGQGRGLSRGKKFLPDKKGSDEDRMAAYQQFLTALEFWALSYPKNSLLNPSKSNNLCKYYQYLKQVQRYEFPSNPLLQKWIKEANDNFGIHKVRNQIALNEIKEELEEEQIDQILNKLRKSDKKVSDSSLPKQKTEKSLPKQAEKKTQSKASIPPNNSNSKLESQRESEKKQESKKSLPAPSDKNIHKPAQTVPKQSKQTKLSPEKTQKTNTGKEESKASSSSLKPPQNHQQASLEKKEVTPGGDPSQNFQSSENFRRQLVQLEEGMGVLKTSEKNLPKNMKYLIDQKQIMQKSLQTTNFSEEELEQLAGKFFEIADKIQRIEPIYQKYKKGEIDYDEFCQTAKTGKSRIASKQNLPESKPSQQQLSKNGSKIGQSVKEEIKSEKKVLQKQQKVESKKQNGVIREQRTSLHAKVQEQKFILDEKKEDVSVYIPSPEKEERNEEKVEFERSQFDESRFTNNVAHEKVQQNHHQVKQVEKSQQVLKNSSAHEVVSRLKSQEVEIEESRVKAKAYRKVKKVHKMVQESPKKEIEELPNQSIHPITISPGQKEEKNVQSSEVRLSEVAQVRKSKTPKHKDSPKEVSEEKQKYMQQEVADDEETIECPTLNPLDNSFHQEQEEKQKYRKKKPKNFKDAISTEEYIKKGTKHQSIYWLQSQADNIIKTVPQGSHKKSRISSAISVPELIDERNRKFESDLKKVQENKDHKIRELEDKLSRVENEKSTISEQLRFREQQVRSLREEDGRSLFSAEQVNYIDDQNSLLKKMNVRKHYHSNYSHRKQDFQKASHYENLISSCKLINTRVFAEYFKDFHKEKNKKMHLKNKELLYKDSELQVGSMGHRQGNSYKITCYITPEADMKLLQIDLDHDANLKIATSVQETIKIKRKYQQKVFFLIDVVDVPYHIPYVILHYEIDGNRRKIRLFLPCAFHKFFKIQQIGEEKLNDLFEQRALCQRGQQIPYSKRILKNLEVIQDYLPHATKLREGLADQHGEICYGGIASYKKRRFPIKFCVKPNQFLYIRAINNSEGHEDQKILDFYVATLNHFLMKEISWEGM